MILQGSLRMEYNNEPFGLMVKTFVINGVYYFFVTDKEREKSLLSGQTLQLTFTDSFSRDDKEDEKMEGKVPAEIVSAIENMLLKNKELWYY